VSRPRLVLAGSLCSCLDSQLTGSSSITVEWTTHTVSPSLIHPQTCKLRARPPLRLLVMSRILPPANGIQSARVSWLDRHIIVLLTLLPPVSGEEKGRANSTDRKVALEQAAKQALVALGESPRG
jgi:hypothetical protein